MSGSWYTVERVPDMSIKEFARIHDLKLVVRERRVPVDVARRSPDNRFYATFESADVKGDGVLIGKFGNGATIDEAIQDYAREISVTTLVVGAWGSGRREIVVPRLAHYGEEASHA